VTITGHDFGFMMGRIGLVGSRGSVEQELFVMVWDGDHVIAHLPDALAAGTYRLAIVTHGNGRNPGASDMIDITIVPTPPATQGLQGPAGSAGPARTRVRKVRPVRTGCQDQSGCKDRSVLRVCRVRAALAFSGEAVGTPPFSTRPVMSSPTMVHRT
jgi:hypothetical protein